MENLFLESCSDMPHINLDANSGIMLIEGSSYPEDSDKAYTPILAWLNNYFSSSPVENTIFNIELVYCNSASSKIFYDLFDLLSSKSKEHKIKINWIYDEENDVAIEMAEDFMEDFDNLDFIMVEK
jgi:hypothetical protein